MRGYLFRRFLEARGINPKEQRTEYKGIEIPIIDNTGTVRPANGAKRKDVKEQKIMETNIKDKSFKETSQKLERNDTDNKKEIKIMKKTTENKQTRNSIMRFLETRGLETGILEVENEGAVLPNKIVTAHFQDIDKLDLSKDVRVVETIKGYGNYSILKKSNQQFKRAVELEKTGLVNAETIDMEYEIETYRGHVPISTEMVDDADFDVVALLGEHLNELDINTKNAEIIAKMKTATPKAMTGAVEIKEFVNKEIITMRNAKAYVSKSLFNELDKLKGENGAPLLEKDTTVKSGKRISGKEIEIIEDEQIGTVEGDLVGFFGDLHEFITLFDRKKDIIKWEDDGVYGSKLVGSVRIDTQVADTDTGFYVTYTPETQGQ